MTEQLKALCTFDCISGDENTLAQFIENQAQKFADEVKTDNLGNVIAFKKGSNPNGKSLMLSAHMDEVGFMVTYITDEGLLKFSPVGGVDSDVIIGSRVRVGEKKTLGVIGNKPIHLLNESERKAKVKMDSLYIDIGAKDKAQAEEYVSLGDNITFESDFTEFGEGFVKGKAIDDRVGCMVLLDIMREQLPLDTYFVFSAQEEVGCIGAQVAAQAISPDYAIVVETTTAADNVGFGGADRVCVLGKGPVISYMDKGTIYTRELFQYAKETAEKNKINWQTKTGVFGGNDASVIHKANAGVKTIAVSVPCRNLHTQSVVAKKEDIENTLKLVTQMVKDLI